MDSEKVDRLSALSALQIAALAIAGSTIAAVTTLIGLRRLGMVRRRTSENFENAQPSVQVRMPPTVPNHFSEEVVIPGVTYTGADVLRQDELEGRSPEGV
jgi:hypothetical protein